MQRQLRLASRPVTSSPQSSPRYPGLLEQPIPEYRMRHWPIPSPPILALCFLTAIGLALGMTTSNSAPVTATAPELPALPSNAWLNSKPLSLAALRGHPVLIEFWTFGCSNCRNSLPWMKTIHTRYSPQGLTVIAIHSPEFEHEHNRAAVAAHVRQFGIDYPVLVDNDFRYWQALGNRFWPAFYLVDPQGRITAKRIGELHSGERSSDEFERAIAALISSQ
jgi:thiol-disulfide isomerase/thioredoxin